jgi:hypothetical protein
MSRVRLGLLYRDRQPKSKISVAARAEGQGERREGDGRPVGRPRQIVAQKSATAKDPMTKLPTI